VESEAQEADRERVSASSCAVTQSRLHTSQMIRRRLIVWLSFVCLCDLAFWRASLVRSVGESPLVASGAVDVQRELNWPIASPETLGWLIYGYPLPWLLAGLTLEMRWRRGATSTWPYVVSVALGANVLMTISCVSQEVLWLGPS